MDSAKRSKQLPADKHCQSPQKKLKPTKTRILELFQDRLELETARVESILTKEGYKRNTLRKALSRLVSSSILLRIKEGYYAVNNNKIPQDVLPGKTPYTQELFFLGKNLGVHDLRITAKKLNPELFSLAKGFSSGWIHNKKGNFIAAKFGFLENQSGTIQIFTNGTVEIHLECRENPLSLKDLIEFEGWCAGFIKALGEDFQESFSYTRFHANEDHPELFLHGPPIRVRVFRDSILEIYQKKLGLRFEYQKLGKTKVPLDVPRRFLSHLEALEVATETKKQQHLDNIVAKSNRNLHVLHKQFQRLNSNINANMQTIRSGQRVTGDQILELTKNFATLTEQFSAFLALANIGNNGTNVEPRDPDPDGGSMFG